MSQPTLTINASEQQHQQQPSQQPQHMQPWEQQMQATTLELEHLQRQLAEAQAQDTKARFAAEVAAAAAAQQQQHEEHQQQLAQSHMHHQTNQMLQQQYQQLNPMAMPTSDSLSPNMAGTPVYMNGISPTLSQASSFNGSLSPSVNPNLGFYPFGPQTPQNGFMSGSPNLGMDMTQGMDTQQPTNRTVYVGNLPAAASVDELLSQVRFGPIESVKILPEKSCAFISFLTPGVAEAFHSDMVLRKIHLHEQELKVGWGKPSALSSVIANAVQSHGASRNVYVGGLPPDMTEEALRDELARFGYIDQVKLVRDKNIGFVHFLSIATALKVVTTLPQDPQWQGRRVNFGKDRCAYVPKNQHQQQQHNMQAAAMAASYTGNWGQMSAQMSAAMNNNAMSIPAGQRSPAENSLLAQAGNRTVYLGNIHPDTTVEEICNAVRGGILQNVRYLPEKHICFITFVDPNSALAFFSSVFQNGITIHARRLRLGWGRNQPLSPGVQMVVQAGGSRNVYIGGLDDSFDEDKLRADFSDFGEIELVNILREKSCGFVNFLSISDAIKSIEGIRKRPEYANLKVSYGKDRCGNVSRAFSPRVLSPSNHNANHKHASNNKTSPQMPPASFAAGGSPNGLSSSEEEH